MHAPSLLSSLTPNTSYLLHTMFLSFLVLAHTVMAFQSHEHVLFLLRSSCHACGNTTFGSVLILLLSPAPPLLCCITVVVAPLSSDGLNKATVCSDLPSHYSLLTKHTVVHKNRLHCLPWGCCAPNHSPRNLGIVSLSREKGPRQCNTEWAANPPWTHWSWEWLAKRGCWANILTPFWQRPNPLL